MDQAFIDDIAKYEQACASIEALMEPLKPWTQYREQLTQYIVAKYFRDYTTGRHPFALPDGRIVEFERKENVAVNEDLLPIVFDEMIGSQNKPEGVPYTDDQVRALHQLHKLVRWTPALDKRQYDKLPEDAKRIFDKALTRTPAKPGFTVKAKG